jgi:hydrogenase maturation protease
MRKKLGVIGLGNPLRRDDGIGILLLQYLQQNKKELSQTIDFFDGGTSGMNLLHLIEDYDTIFLLDAVDFKGKPGEMKKFTIDEIKNQKLSLSLSTHEPDLLSVIMFLKGLEKIPKKLLIFGVQPKDMSYGMELSDELQDVLPELQEQILKEIQSLI